MSTINGYKLSAAEEAALNEMQNYLSLYGGDSAGPNESPVGDGRWVPLLEVWGRGNTATARRRSILRLVEKGVLASCEMSYMDGCVRLG